VQNITPVAAAGVDAVSTGVVELPGSVTPVVFDAYLTQAGTTDTALRFQVVNGGTGYLGTETFGAVLPSGTVTIAAGQTMAAFTIDVPQNALGTDPSAKLEVQIASPGSVVPIFAPDATVSVVNDHAESGAPPIPLLSDLSFSGTLTHVGNSYTLDLGTFSQGGAASVVQLALSNEATPPADSLSGTFGVPTGTGFLVIGNYLNAAITPGNSYTGLEVQALTTNPGDNTETLKFLPTAINDSGYSGTLSPITLTIKDNVVTPAAARLNTPSSIIYQNVRVGTADNTALSISNTAVAPAGALSVTGAAFGYATVEGSVTGLAPGQTDITSVHVGLNTDFAGMLAGIVQLTPASTSSNGGSMALSGTSAVDLFGNVYRLASGTIAPMTTIVHVGDTGVLDAVISNTATADGFSESLIASLGSVTGDFIKLGTGSTGDIVAGGSNATAIAFGFDATQAGTIGGTATIDLVSDGGAGANSIDGLGTMALDSLTAPISVIVDNYATAAVSSAGDLTQTGTNTFLLNLGTADVSHGALTAGLTITNSATGPADFLNGTFAAKTSTNFSDLGFGAFSDIGAGGSLIAGTISLSELNAGAFSQTITLMPTDTNASGYSGKIGGETITVIGTVAAPSGGGSGDVHITTFSGLHYNFQSVGDYIMERSTQPDDSFQVQIQTSPGTAAVSLTTKVAAQVGADFITFASNRANMVWINGYADTGLTGPNAVQTFAGGQIKELSATDYKITWATGESLTVSNPGTFEGVSYLNTSISLGANDPPGSIQGLLGSDTGQANDFQLPNGTVLLQPVSQQELIGPFATAWAVSSSTSLLDDSTNAMRFLASPGAGDLQASSANQVLQATGGITTMSDPNHLGAVFQGALVALSDVLISSFSTKDKIDVTNVAGATARYTGTDQAGTLLVSNGTISGSIHLSGQLSGAAFHVASDQHGGSIITYS
jgi:hypothetical protein